VNALTAGDFLFGDAPIVVPPTPEPGPTPVEPPVPVDGDTEAGDVLIAVNANGGALQTVINGETIDFAANTGGGNGSTAIVNGITASFTGASGFSDGTGTSGGGANGAQPGFDGTIFDSERFGQDLGFNGSNF